MYVALRERRSTDHFQVNNGVSCTISEQRRVDKGT